MKGGGLTWVGWLMVGTGAVLLYAGMTGGSVVADVSAVLNGKHPATPGQAAAPDFTPGGGSNSSANAAEQSLSLSQQNAARSVVPHPVVGGFQVATP